MFEKQTKQTLFKPCIWVDHQERQRRVCLVWAICQFQPLLGSSQFYHKPISIYLVVLEPC